MGVAVWRRERSEREPRPPARGETLRYRFRLVVFGEARGAWRDRFDEVMKDAIALGLASWDAGRREHYLAVPVDVQRAVVANAG